MPPPYQAFVSVPLDEESGSTAKRLMSALKVGTCGLRGCHTNDNAHALYFCPPFGLMPFLPLEDIVFARVSVKMPRMTETLQAAFSNKSPSVNTLVRPNEPSSLSHASSQKPSWFLSAILLPPSNRVNSSHNSFCHSKRKDSKSSPFLSQPPPSSKDEDDEDDDAFNEIERNAR